MKKIFLGLTLLSFFLSGLLVASSGISFEAGGFYGQRQVADADIKKIYGNGMVYSPCASIIWNGVMLGGGYEGGYSKSGKIGIYEEATSLEIKGYELFLGYRLKMKFFAPYIKVGYGSFSYKQTNESKYVGEYKVDHKMTAVTLGGGLKIYPIKYLYIAGEVKYVPLKVKPFEDEVDLSGLRLLAGLGISI